MRLKSPTSAFIIAVILARTASALACGSPQSVTVPSPTAVNLQAAVNTASSYLSGCPADTYTINIPAGSFSLGTPPGSSPLGAINVSGVLAAGATGRLIIAGAGQGAGGTTLIVPTTNSAGTAYSTVYGRSAFNVTFQKIHFAASAQTASYGTVVSFTTTTVTLNVPPGLPTPLDLFTATTTNTSGRYLRAYTNSTSNPTLVQEVQTGSTLTTSNPQVPWGNVGGTLTAPVRDPSGPNNWKIYLNFSTNLTATNVYTPGVNLICIRAKGLGGAFEFLNSQGIVFDQITWTERSRGVFRAGSSNETVSNSSVLRGPANGGQAQCLSTAEGGPQFGQPGEPTSGNTVINFTAQAPGDDAVAFFDDIGATGPTPQPPQSTIDNLNISDSFARFVLFTNSANVPVPNINIIDPITGTDCDPVYLGAGACPIDRISASE